MWAPAPVTCPGFPLVHSGSHSFQLLPRQLAVPRGGFSCYVRVAYHLRKSVRLLVGTLFLSAVNKVKNMMMVLEVGHCVIGLT